MVSRKSSCIDLIFIVDADVITVRRIGSNIISADAALCEVGAKVRIKRLRACEGETGAEVPASTCFPNRFLSKSVGGNHVHVMPAVVVWWIRLFPVVMRDIS